MGAVFVKALCVVVAVIDGAMSPRVLGQPPYAWRKT